ncbi:MAG TPA: VOC family protein [Candidatus Thermoplasmatota archaeon]|nr:VOC family protein [Candidatus Thermoplasmatota archaeon]
MAAKTAKRARAPRKTSKVAVEGVTPFLWFEKDAEEAARFYVSVFQGSRIVSASPMSVEFNLAGQDFYALNGGPTYKLTPAYSMFVRVKGQEEVDRLWETLTEGGEPSMCGWLVDRFGLSWQIIPERLPQLLFHKDPEVARRATQAMLRMTKIDVAALEEAAFSGRPRKAARRAKA